MVEPSSEEWIGAKSQETLFDSVWQRGTIKVVVAQILFTTLSGR